jgi:hypothetical protein
VNQEVSTRRIGVLCYSPDRVAQVLADDLISRGALIERITETGISEVDEIIVISHQLFLACAQAILAQKKPCTVIYRRPKGDESTEAWETGVRFCAAVMESDPSGYTQAACLSEEAAAAVESVIGHKPEVLPLPGLPAGTRTLATMDQDVKLIRLQDGFDTILEADAVNWGRLRRYVELSTSENVAADLKDVIKFANGGDQPAVAMAQSGHSGGQMPYLVVVPNGVGIGHLTRMLTLARVLNRKTSCPVIFWCYSRAAQIIQAAGFPVLLRQTADHLGTDPALWRSWEMRAFRELIRQTRPHAVIYDGSTIDQFIVRALAAPENGSTALVWVRRAMWQKTSDASVLEAAQYCDLIIEPGDLAEQADTGPTTRISPRHRGFSRLVRTRPITMLGRQDLLSRKQARKKLNMKRGKYCLISLGADVFADRDILTAQIAEAAANARISLVWAQSPLAGAPRLPKAIGPHICQTYPLSRYLNGFDGVISATGYNSFHELMLLFDGPVLFAPTVHKRLDDQTARARHAAKMGWAEVLDPEEGVNQFRQIADFMAGIRSQNPFGNRPHCVSGVEETADAILALQPRYSNRLPV